MPPLLSSNHLVKPRDDSVFDLLVKVYPDGLVSSHIGRLALGDSLLCTAPLGVFSELLKGVDALGMVAGGTGEPINLIFVCRQEVQWNALVGGISVALGSDRSCYSKEIPLTR